MSSRRVREKIRLQRMAFDLEVEKARQEREKSEMLDNMTKAELIEYAEANGIEIDKTAKKAEILGKLK
jgi:hypothetical protein